MREVRLSSWIVLAAIALIAIAAWPFVGTNRANAARSYFAPVQSDYEYRDRTVAFYEKRIRQDPEDQISARMLGAEYMQRYREALDVGDIVRGIHQAQRSLRLQPANNSAADEIAASGFFALHDFKTALKYEAAARREQPADVNAPAQMALLHMELGRYDLAVREIGAARHIRDGPAVWAAQARYDELTGNIAQAKRLMSLAAERSDSIVDNSAEARAWYHFRLGEMAFATGAVTDAEAQERLALSEFPHFALAYRALARFCRGVKDWNCALEAAQKGADIIPDPETLGYKADAQQATGDTAGAQETQALIFAVERLGNAYHINDRLLAAYYSAHAVRLDDALQIARREASVRGNEIFAQDTLAWAAAMDRKWDVAEQAARKATRYNTQDPRIQFHAGMIALHFGHIAEARTRLENALALNSQFDPFYADRARETLQQLAAHGEPSPSGY